MMRWWCAGGSFRLSEPCLEGRPPALLSSLSVAVTRSADVREYSVFSQLCCLCLPTLTLARLRQEEEAQMAEE